MSGVGWLAGWLAGCGAMTAEYAHVDWERLRERSPGSGTGRALPHGWTEGWDDATGRYYYYCTLPGHEAVNWAPPPAAGKAKKTKTGIIHEPCAGLWGAGLLHNRRVARSSTSKEVSWQKPK